MKYKFTPSLIRFAVLIALGLLFLSSCTGSNPDPEPLSPSGFSLLDIVPFIGDETEIREPAQETSRLVIAETSVEGWIAPSIPPDKSEGILRFPVTLRENARLSIQIGVSDDLPSDLMDIHFNIEYTHDSSGTNSETHSVYQTSIRQSQNLPSDWEKIDISLAELSPGTGELRLIVNCTQPIPSGLEILWGAPAIYYPDERNHRNVLLIGVDTLRADGISVYGGKRIVTPKLEAFSYTATTFTHAWSQSSWTLPSFASIVTGGLPSVIGTTIHSGRIPGDAVTIGEMLRPAGYATATICSNTYLGNNQSGFHQGMDELWFRFSASPQASVDQTIEYISRTKDRDWFCFLHFLDPHGPYTPPEKYAGLLCDPNYSGAFGYEFHADEEWKSCEVAPPDDEIRHVRNLYDGEIASVDEALSKLFRYLEANGLYDETLIIISSDHGEEFFEHGGFEHGHTHYEEMVRMPLMVRGEGFPQDERTDICVGNMDIVPTILQYLQMPIPDTLEGYPLQEAVHGNIGNDRIIFGEGNNRGTDRKFAVHWPYKAIYDFVTGETRLFDLENDPGETVNIRDANPEIANGLSQAMAIAMLPDSTIFHIWFMGSFFEPSKQFTGSLEFSTGIEKVQAFGMTDSDSYSVDGNTMTFDISNDVPELGIDKHFTIFPSSEDVSLDASLLVDGKIEPDYFYPYGTLDSEPSGHASVRIEDYPLGPEMPIGELKLPPGMYIWGIQGFSRDDFMQELDPESIEQLKALGYIH